MDMISSLSRSFSNSIALIVAIPFVLIALYFLYSTWSSGRRVRASQSWTQTMGRVVMSNVEVSRGSDTGTSYYPNIIYEYQVNGQRYQNNRFSLGMRVGLGNALKVQEQVNRYPVGSSIPVYYDPANPSQSVLERNAPANRYLLIAALFIFAILACTLSFTLGMNDFVSRILSMVPH